MNIINKKYLKKYNLYYIYQAHDFYMFSLAALGCEQPSSLEEEIELTNNVKIPAMLNAAACQIESKVIFFFIFLEL